MEHLGKRESVSARAATKVSRLEPRNETDFMEKIKINSLYFKITEESVEELNILTVCDVTSHTEPVPTVCGWN
jgi:hypothetical protein